MRRPRSFPILIPLTALAFAAVHLTFEHFTVGVPSHHMLNRPDLPAISNWFGLVTLPLLGVVLGLRVRALHAPRSWAGVPIPVLAAILGALVYGGAMGASFSLGAESITTAAFLGLFVCGIVLPVYRIEYILGFVAGMSVTFGGVLPLPVALVVATISFVVRYIIFKLMGAIRKKKVESG